MVENKTKLTVIDLDAESVPMASVESEIKELNKLEIVDTKTGDFRADVTGQKGNICFCVQGKDRVFNLGADAVVKLSMATGLKVVIADKKLGAFVTSEHYTKLRSAQKRQIAKVAKKKKS